MYFGLIRPTFAETKGRVILVPLANIQQCSSAVVKKDRILAQVGFSYGTKL